MAQRSLDDGNGLLSAAVAPGVDQRDHGYKGAGDKKSQANHEMGEMTVPSDVQGARGKIIAEPCQYDAGNQTDWSPPFHILPRSGTKVIFQAIR
jgi:hypothetical protein